eukprot:TRINITY_DN2171_c0_g1_i2.p1 TRINITY_DN2171_c0_g1~~TRINITY_DN2171_c0_g1_i2.p1  ORF type:complete len:287 (-),score=54.54 TRINITY_DN2171_c0_g1_i2:262-1053(-)
MGNNYVKQLGIKPQKEIGSRDFRTLWMKYAEPGGKKISRKNAKKFLKDFVAAIKVKYEPAMCRKLFQECDPTNSGWLDEDQFANLFFASAKASLHHQSAETEIILTASLVEKKKKLTKTGKDAGSGSSPGRHSADKIPFIFPRRDKISIQEEASDAKSDITSRSLNDDDNAKSDLSLTTSTSHVRHGRVTKSKTCTPSIMARKIGSSSLENSFNPNSSRSKGVPLNLSALSVDKDSRVSIEKTASSQGLEEKSQPSDVSTNQA